MSLLGVPRVGSWWENPKQPDALVEVVNLVIRSSDSLVIFQWGPSRADVSAYTVKKFLETFTERGA